MGRFGPRSCRGCTVFPSRRGMRHERVCVARGRTRGRDTIGDRVARPAPTYSRRTPPRRRRRTRWWIEAYTRWRVARPDAYRKHIAVNALWMQMRIAHEVDPRRRLALLCTRDGAGDETQEHRRLESRAPRRVEELRVVWCGREHPSSLRGDPDGVTYDRRDAPDHPWSVAVTLFGPLVPAPGTGS